MIQRYRLIFAFIFVLYVVAQLVSFGLAGRQSLGWFERGVVFITAPGQKLLSWTFSGVAEIWRGYFFLVGAAAERDRLKQRVSELESRLISAKELEQKVQRLQILLDIPAQFYVKTLGAERIAMGTSPFQRVMRVRHTGAQPILPGMAVLSPRGVVGQVMRATVDTADVLLIVDKSSAVAVIDQRSRATGIVRGDNLDRLRFEYARRGTDLKVGDQIITSGLDAVYQKGIPVGVITEVNTDPNKLYIEAYVKPHIEFSLVEEVAIVTQMMAVPTELEATVTPDTPAPTPSPIPTSTPSPTPKPTRSPRPVLTPSPTQTPYVPNVGREGSREDEMLDLPMADEEMIP